MTVGSQFRQSLQLLMETLNATTPHYVRCIKPNDDKSAFVFDPHRATQQLRACGVLETVRISAAGFPSRWTYTEFMQRYRMLAIAKTLKRNGDQRENCAKILEILLKDPDKFQFGNTKIFFRAGQVAYMEKLRNDKLNQAAIMIQKVVKSFVYRQRYLRTTKTIRGIQRYGRGVLARRRAQTLRETAAAITIQTTVRGFLARRRYQKVRKLALQLQCLVRGYLARKRCESLRSNRAALVIQTHVRGFLERRRFARTMRKVVLCQAATRRFLAKKLRKRMKEEEKKVEHWKTQYKGLENKIISQKQEMIDLAKARDEARNKLSSVEHQWKDKVRTLEDLLKVADDRNKEYEERMNALKEALELSRKGEMDANDRIRVMSSEIEQLRSSEKEIPTIAKESMVAQLVADPAHATNIDGTSNKWASEKRLLVKELEELKTDYQRLLEERDGMMSKIYGDPHSSPSNTLRVHHPHHQRTPSEVSAGSDPGREGDETMDSVERDNGYGTVSRNGSIREDVTTILKFEKRIKNLEAQNSELIKQLEYQQQLGEPSIKDMMRLHELFRENAKLKESLKNMSMAESSQDYDPSSSSVSEDGKDGGTNGPEDRGSKTKALLEELWAELDTKREEIRGLREALTREGQGLSHLPNREEEGEIYMAFETQKTMLTQLENELKSVKMSARDCEQNLNAEIRQLREYNQQLQQIMSSEMTPAEKATCFLQGEIARLSRENVDLKEKYDRAIEQIRRLKRQNKTSSNQHNSSHQDVTDSMPLIRHKTETSGSFLGMLEYKIEDETHIIRSLIIDLKPKVTQQLLPALPAFILIMMIRHVDHCNDDQKVRSLLNNVITNVRRVIKKRKDDLEYTAMWLTIMYRFFNNLRQYSGEEVYQNENTPRQNEQCLRNFDLSQYRQIISDICLFIYTQMIRSMTDKLQKIVIPAIVEHDATSGSQLFRRKMSLHHDTSRHEVDVTKALDQLLEELTAFNKLIQSHQVDVDVRVVMFKELYHFVCAMSLNNLLLRRDMCHWSKGVQIRHNLSRLEHWSREQHLFGVNDLLAPAIQAVQVLQARKREEHIPDICEMAPNLTSGQLLRICQMYTPVEGYEESFSPKFINRLQEYIKNTFPKDNSKDYLMDTKARLAVRFQYIPSDVQLETITVPEVLNLPMLKRI
ncbi:hypothetical protein BIW11_12909 [Tropilaelaps mercedesae]|uniref:Unconventional myosin-Va-like n=1 Tax=Tropilaelaps mercedesae TaxID=418985 RepID=A0A1V9X4N2_9ACAR|nr:hypothetical protein BIW11_12909 [Tropilaelaps mercedesae]